MPINEEYRVAFIKEIIEDLVICSIMQEELWEVEKLFDAPRWKAWKYGEFEGLERY